MLVCSDEDDYRPITEQVGASDIHNQYFVAVFSASIQHVDTQHQHFVHSISHQYSSTSIGNQGLITDTGTPVSRSESDTSACVELAAPAGVASGTAAASGPLGCAGGRTSASGTVWYLYLYLY